MNSVVLTAQKRLPDEFTQFETIKITKPEWKIGRALANDSVIPFVGMSRHQCEFKKEPDDTWKMYNLGSFGTGVNGQLIAMGESIGVKSSDTITLDTASKFSFTFNVVPLVEITNKRSAEQQIQSKNKRTKIDKDRVDSSRDVTIAGPSKSNHNELKNDKGLTQAELEYLRKKSKNDDKAVKELALENDKLKKELVNRDTFYSEKLAMLNNKLQEEIVCPICYEIYDKPMILQCGHTFCKKCLNLYKKKNKDECPNCRSPMDEGNPNISVASIIDCYIQNWDKEKREDKSKTPVKRTAKSKAPRATNKRYSLRNH